MSNEARHNNTDTALGIKKASIKIMGNRRYRVNEAGNPPRVPQHSQRDVTKESPGA